MVPADSNNEQREGSYARTSEHIYLAMIQLDVLYRPETGVLTPHMQRVLGGFHHRVALRLMWRQPQKGWGRGWVYPPLEDAMAEAGYRRWKPTSLASRIPWHNILRLGPLWTCVWRESGGYGQEWKCSGGNRRVCIWRGYGRRPRRRSRRRGRSRRQTGRIPRRNISKVRRILW